MKSNRNNSRLLKWLAISTALALLGIVVLQAYWLRTSYVEQKSRFSADVENAMMATLIKSQITVAMDNAGLGELKGMEPALSEMLASVLSKIPASVRNDSGSAKRSITVKMTGSESVEAEALQQYLRNNPAFKDSGDIILKLNKSTRSSYTSKLTSLKKILDAELQKRAIKTPSALAIFDSSGRLSTATCDTSEFKAIPVKSALTDASYSQSDVQLQAAFPDANLYLLRRMSWLFSVTLLLMVICCVSFTVLIRAFFRQKRLADIRNDFMNNMTHELKTPIASVSVALELMQDQRYHLTEEKKAEYFGIAQGELQRLSMLVEKVLKMAYFEKGEIRISPEPILAAAWIKNILNSMRPVFEVANARVSSKIQPELMMFYADKTHLTNVIQNLLENALKYNGNEEPRIQIDIYEEGAFAVLNVSDNGKGIPSNYVDKVFDKFFRVPTGDRHDTKGYGLGLSYVKAIAELHGGTVTVSSIPNEQTTFMVRLPKQNS